MHVSLEQSGSIRKTPCRRSPMPILLLTLFLAVTVFGAVVAYDEFVTMPWLRRARLAHERYWSARHRLDARQIRERQCHEANGNCEFEAHLVDESIAEIAEIETQSLETLGVHPVALQDFDYRSYLERVWASLLLCHWNVRH